MGLTCPIAHLQPLTDTVMQVVLHIPPGKNFAYTAGQYVEIIQDQQHIPFSIANAPLGSREIELHIRHTKDNQIVQQIMQSIRSEQALNIVGPLGHSIYQSAKMPTILLAGGTGFAPLKAMIEQAFTNGDEEPMHLFWGARSASDLYMHELAEHWQNAVEHFQYTPVLSQANNTWQGKTGILYDIVVQVCPDLTKYRIFAAGPPEMVVAAWKKFQTAGLKRDNIFADVL